MTEKETTQLLKEYEKFKLKMAMAFCVPVGIIQKEILDIEGMLSDEFPDFSSPQETYKIWDYVVEEFETCIGKTYLNLN